MPSALTQQTIRLTPELQAAVQAAASSQGISLYRWLIQAVNTQLAIDQGRYTLQNTEGEEMEDL